MALTLVSFSETPPWPTPAADPRIQVAPFLLLAASEDSSAPGGPPSGAGGSPAGTFQRALI